MRMESAKLSRTDQNREVGALSSNRESETGVFCLSTWLDHLCDSFPAVLVRGPCRSKHGPHACTSAASRTPSGSQKRCCESLNSLIKVAAAVGAADVDHRFSGCSAGGAHPTGLTVVWVDWYAGNIAVRELLRGSTAASQEQTVV